LFSLFEPFGGFIIGDCKSDCIQLFQSYSPLQVLAGFGQRQELFEGCHHGLMGVGFSLLAFGIDFGNGKETRPMVVDIGIQVFLMKLVNQRCPVLTDMAIAEVFSDDGAILGFDQGIVIGLSGARFGQLDVQLFQKLNDMLIDVLRAVVGMEADDDKRELIQ
jgi:hypothetical protein